jgi:hypothetical protein
LEGEEGRVVPTIKITLTDLEMQEVKDWACGSALAPFAKQALLHKVRGSHRLPQVAPGSHKVPTVTGSQEAPQVATGNQGLPGTESATPARGHSPEKNIEKEETAQRLIGHFNQTCGGLVATMDKSAIKCISEKLETYTEADARAVIEWGNSRWPRGDLWRERCLNITHLFGDKFSGYLTATTTPKSSAEQQWKPKKEQPHERRERLDREEAERNAKAQG